MKSRVKLLLSYAFVLVSSARPARARGLRERRTKLTNGEAIASRGGRARGEARGERRARRERRVDGSTGWPSRVGQPLLAVVLLDEARHLFGALPCLCWSKRKC